MIYIFALYKVVVRTLTLIGFIVIPLSFWLVQIFGKKANRVSEERRKFEGEYDSFLNNSFQNWTDIKTNNLELCMEAEFDKYRKILAKLIVKSQIYIALNWLFVAFKDYFVTRMNL